MFQMFFPFVPNVPNHTTENTVWKRQKKNVTKCKPLDISKGKVDLLLASTAKMIKLFHFFNSFPLVRCKTGPNQREGHAIYFRYFSSPQGSASVTMLQIIGKVSDATDYTGSALSMETEGRCKANIPTY